MKPVLKHAGNISRNWLQKTLIVSLLIALTIVMSGCGKTAAGSGKSDTIHIATKGFAESDILANAIKLLIENDTKLKTTIQKLDNALLWGAIQENKIDTYVEYTGTALINILKEQPEFDSKKSYEKVKKLLKEKNQITVLDPIGFNNTYAFALHKEVADKYKITKTSQLAEKSGEINFGASQEFLNRPDAWPPIVAAYNPKFKEIKNIQDKGIAYKALEQKIIDSFILYSTDAQISVSPLVVLEDDKHVFLPYDAIPIIRDGALKEHPEIKDAINKLSGKLNDSEILKLNAEVELKQRPALDVAKEWLIAKGLIKK